MFLEFIFSKMSFQPPEKKQRISSFEKAKSLFLKGDMEGAFIALREGDFEGNASACFDIGFMLIQGIGCLKNLKEGMELIKKGCDLFRNSKDDSWKSNGRLSELFEPQSMDLNSLLIKLEEKKEKNGV